MSVLPHADPGRGVFETMLVIAGRPVEIDAHLGRLGTSVETLYGRPLPGQARRLVLARAAQIEHGKLRLTVVPPQGRLAKEIEEPAEASGDLALEVEAEEVDVAAVFPGADRGAALRSAVVAGGLGEHKWIDRDLLDRAAASAPGELPLLLDADGAVLEASRASVFVVRGERLLTPPTDGRILPSIARQQVIEVASAGGIETDEKRLTLADLLAGEVFLTGSVRGVEPARALDGVGLAAPSELSGRIAAELRRRWGVPAAEPVVAVAGGQPGGRPGR
jgi:branched-subunit amino acid aminotransferase/4-amino-4-deoxychorismate lyase